VCAVVLGMATRQKAPYISRTRLSEIERGVPPTEEELQAIRSAMHTLAEWRYSAITKFQQGAEVA
jgi:hypothetical protein